MSKRKDETWNDFLIILLSAYANFLRDISNPKKWHVKSSGQEYKGTTYFQEGVGFTDGFGNLLEWR